MIPIADADAYLKRLLAEDGDTDAAAFPQALRYRALQEAAVAIAGLRPDQFAELIDLSYATNNAYILPSTHSALIEVIGLKSSDGAIKSLLPSSPGQKTSDNQCWWTTSDSPVTNFLWSRGAPRYVFVDGFEADTTLLVFASVTPAIDGNETDINLSPDHLPAVMSYAAYRCFSLEHALDKANYFYGQFRQQIADMTSAYSAISPMILAKETR